MITQLISPTDELRQISSQLWRISVGRYHEMIEAGLLTEHDRLELLEGFLIEKMAVNPPHAYVTERLRETLGQILPDGWFVSAQQPLTTSDSEPEPDVMIVAGQRRDYLEHHPRPADVALLIEVSDATLSQDQGWKKRIYARAGIVTYWVVNLPDRQIEVYSEPSGKSSNPTYDQLSTYHETDDIPVVVSGKALTRLPVQDLLP